MARQAYWKQQERDEPRMVTIRQAKKLLKDCGGEAWIEHYERDGTCFEITEIELYGNNSRFQYNRHL